MSYRDAARERGLRIPVGRATRRCVGRYVRHARGLTCKHFLAYINNSDMDRVFKALASPARRRLLDTLRAHNGQTLGELCTHLDMTRQAVTQHLSRLEGANLIATIRRGREKLHYLNRIPIHEIYERWIVKYERQRLDALRELKKRVEGD